jgi:dethiobiotin synthase
LILHTSDVTPQTVRGLFVTGTDTGVGKTVLSAALMHRGRQRGSGWLRYWKPIQTGIEEDDDTAEVARLGVCSDAELFHAGIRLPRPVSPHLAAHWQNTTIEIGPLADAIGREAAGTRWIVEGAGGVLVPINARETMIDLMAALGLPIVVAARSRLGTINHTLLTLEALRHRRLHVAGVVMIGACNRDNREAIERYGEVDVLELPQLDPLTPGALRTWADGLDPHGPLPGYL